MKMRTETYNYVTGWADHDGNGYTDGRAVIGQKTQLKINYDHPVTLIRCKEILIAAQQLTGYAYSRLDMHLSVYADLPDDPADDMDAADARCTLDQVITYYTKTNSMIIWRNGLPVYANDNGVITRDQNALCDCLM
jgi:hypothetical protein